jgi:hypothetical protein
MKVAYADPPYIGMAKKHYSHEPLCAEVDHVALIGELQEYDAWALSMAATMRSMKTIIAAAPDDARLGAWVKPFAIFKPGVDPAYTWEPVLFRSKRKASKGVNTVRDHISCNITLKKGLVGVKPDEFCWWLFDLLGMTPDDEFVDMFPGSGAVTRAWEQWRSQ